ncbi:MAG TPA: hypothetical protein VGB51_00095 [Actinomycetota bacterium]
MPNTQIPRHIVVMLAVLALSTGGCASDTSPSPSSSPTEPAAEPAPVVTEQGGTYWGVYLAVGEESDLEDAIQYLTDERDLEAGVEFSIGDISCDEGAAEALGAAGTQRVAVYFISSDDAAIWAATLLAEPVGVVEVQTFCLD